MSLDPNVEMNPGELQVFLDQPRMAVLATILRDGMPSLNPVWYLYEGDKFLISVNRNAYYAKNLLRDPRASVCIQEETYPLKGVVARGPVEIAPETEYGVVRRLAIRYRGESEGAQYADRLWAEAGADHLVLKLTPERLASWDYAKR